MPFICIIVQWVGVGRMNKQTILDIIFNQYINNMDTTLFSSDKALDAGRLLSRPRIFQGRLNPFEIVDER